MAATTWNFPCVQLTDWGPNQVPGNPRTNKGRCYVTNPTTKTHPFSTAFTAIFAVNFRTGWSHDNSNWDGSQPVQSVASVLPVTLNDYIAIYFNNYPMRLVFDIKGGGTQRHLISLGDEDGTNWIQMDKWYQVGLSWNTSGISYCVNGSTTPTTTGDTANNPGTITVADPGGRTSENKFQIHQVFGRNGQTTHFFTSQGWPSFVSGPMVFHSGYVDFTDASARANIWDSDGDFIYPGADGSGWIGSAADYYLADGSIAEGRFYNGLNAEASAGTGRIQGGLRKQYE